MVMTSSSSVLSAPRPSFSSSASNIATPFAAASASKRSAAFTPSSPFPPNFERHLSTKSFSPAFVYRLPPNFEHQLSTKARRNCRIIVVTQIVAASSSDCQAPLSTPPFDIGGATSEAAPAEAGADGTVVGTGSGSNSNGAFSKVPFLSSDGHAGERTFWALKERINVMVKSEDKIYGLENIYEINELIYFEQIRHKIGLRNVPEDIKPIRPYVRCPHCGKPKVKDSYCCGEKDEVTRQVNMMD